jgi:hypothetical protein
MQFIRVKNCFKVVRITGPSHNLLGIEFGEVSDSPEEAVVESLPSDGGNTASLSETEVRKNVVLGVAEANREFGTNYVVSRIEFVPTDSPPAETYRALARSIIERLVNRQPFTERA